MLTRLLQCALDKCAAERIIGNFKNVHFELFSKKFVGMKQTIRDTGLF